MKAWYEDSIGYKLSRAARAHRAQVAKALREIGIHPGQEALLQALSTNDGQSMGGLADRMGVRPPTITKMVSRMAAEGLITRAEDNGDGRRGLVFLTDEGNRRANELKKRWRKIEKRMLSAMTDKEVKRFSSALSGAVEAMQTEKK